MKHICRESYTSYGLGENNYKANYTRMIAIGEKSSGNDSVGDMWIETKSFNIDTPVSEILKWAWKNGVSGKLTITIDESSGVGDS
jgi:hypothetical protein